MREYTNFVIVWFPRVIERLPEENILLLRHLSFMLYIISQNAEQNKMNPRNLAVCMAPNLLQIDQVEAVEKVSNFLPCMYF